jgi:crotonobetainyl-CoA:carnitine CoA-transferase CaiB-like acyl-CoA transferase
MPACLWDLHMLENEKKLPLTGIRVVEFTHMIMGPTCGMVLGDLGADVIKVEPLEGDTTRRLLGSGAGFFPLYNRNKKSIALDLKSAAGREVALKLIAGADIVAENFKPETMVKLGLDYDSVKTLNPKLIYVSHKGFLPGPYAHRTALDEVVQMMGGLAYMTGRKGDPVRAGSSVNDMMGGIFGALAALAALRERDASGKGQLVQSALFENNILLVAQHMLQYTVTGVPAEPMPSRISAWAVYDVFTVKNDEQIFLSAVSDGQWKALCDTFNWPDLLHDPRYPNNNARVQLRDSDLIPELRRRFAPFTAAALTEKFEAAGLPFAPIAKPHELIDDEHLNASGGLVPITLVDGDKKGQSAKTALLPFTMDGKRMGVRLNPPRVGEHSRVVLEDLGFSAAQIEAMVSAGSVVLGE